MVVCEMTSKSVRGYRNSECFPELSIFLPLIIKCLGHYVMACASVSVNIWFPSIIGQRPGSIDLIFLWLITGMAVIKRGPGLSPWTEDHGIGIDIAMCQIC
jgi:hypothetical protein